MIPALLETLQLQRRSNVNDRGATGSGASNRDGFEGLHMARTL